MPLVLRSLNPINVGRQFSPDQKKEVESYEELANRTLTNLIRQLATLGHHASDVFSRVESEAKEIQNRADKLSKRTIQVQDQIQKLDQELKLREDIPEIFATLANESSWPIWRSDASTKPGLFLENSRPANIQSLYDQCDKIPCVEVWQKFRHDGKMCNKLYSDKQFFFDTWKNQLLQDLEAEKKLIKKQRKKATKDERTIKTFKKINKKNVSFLAKIQP